MAQEANMNQMGNINQDMLQGMAQGIQQQPNLPPGTYPQQPMGGFPSQANQGYTPHVNQGFPPQQPMGGNVVPSTPTVPLNDMRNIQRGPSIASGAMPSGASNVSPLGAGGTTIAHNPANSPTDAMVNRLAEAERAVKEDRRSQWLSMNQSPASSVLANIGGGDLPAHLRGAAGVTNPAADILTGTTGASNQEAPNEALLRRVSEVALRRVARKRGVAVEAPQTKLEGDVFTVNVTYVDDGRVLDTPDVLTQAFEQAIQTEMALKGYDITCNITMFRSKDGKTEKIGDEEPEEDMFACEMCDGLVKESDSTCPHCGAVFEEDAEETVDQAPPARGGPPGPSKSGGPPGPSKSGGPPGPSKSGGPPGPSKSGGPPGPKKSGGPPGPKKSGGPPGPSKSGGPPKGGPGGSPSGGPPGPSKSGGPPKGGPGGSPSGGPPGPSKSGGPAGPSKSGGPPKGGPGGSPSGGPPGPSKSGGPPGPSKSGGPPKGGPGGSPSGGPPGPKKGGPPGGPKKSGPPGGPKRGPPR